MIISCAKEALAEPGTGGWAAVGSAVLWKSNGADTEGWGYAAPGCLDQRLDGSSCGMVMRLEISGF